MEMTSEQFNGLASWCEDEIGYGIFLGLKKQELSKNIFFGTKKAHLFDKDQNRIGMVGARLNPKPFKLFDLSTWKRHYPIPDETLVEAIARLHEEGCGEAKFAVSFHFAPEQPFMFDDYVPAYEAYVYEL
ncbi:MAG: hypothetical protein WC878_00380 [Candidatus Paceibacterota bacterium]|jgi:hypothetical protein